MNLSIHDASQTKIIPLGRQMSLQKRLDLQKEMYLNKLLKFDELPSNLTFGENHHIIEKFETMWGLLVSEEQNSQVKSLHQVLQEAFQVSRYDGGNLF